MSREKGEGRREKKGDDARFVISRILPSPFSLFPSPLAPAIGRAA